MSNPPVLIIDGEYFWCFNVLFWLLTSIGMRNGSCCWFLYYFVLNFQTLLQFLELLMDVENVEMDINCWNQTFKDELYLNLFKSVSFDPKMELSNINLIKASQFWNSKLCQNLWTHPTIHFSPKTLFLTSSYTL